MSSTQRKHVLATIAAMRKWKLPGLHILAMSHDVPDIRQSLKPQVGEDVTMKNSSVNEDISKYVRGTLENKINLSHWRYEIDTVHDELIERAQGVYVFQRMLQENQACRICGVKWLPWPSKPF